MKNMEYLLHTSFGIGLFAMMLNGVDFIKVLFAIAAYFIYSTKEVDPKGNESTQSSNLKYFLVVSLPAFYANCLLCAIKTFAA